MATEILSSDNLANYRSKYNTLLNEFNAVNNFNTVTADSGSIATGSKNQTFGITGGSNITTSVSATNVVVAVDASPTFTNITVNTTATIDDIDNSGGTTDIADLTINGAYQFPNADGAALQYLVTDGAGNLNWTNQAAATTFLGLSDTAGSFVASAVPYTNSGGTALAFDSDLTYDDTANRLNTDSFYANNKVEIGGITGSNPSIHISKTFTSSIATGGINCILYYNSGSAGALAKSNSIQIVVSDDMTGVYGDDHTITTAGVIVSEVYGQVADINIGISSTVTNVTGFSSEFDTTTSGGNTVTNLYSYYAISQNNFGTITNRYGFYYFSEDAATNDFGIHLDMDSTGATTGLSIDLASTNSASRAIKTVGTAPIQHNGMVILDEQTASPQVTYPLTASNQLGWFLWTNGSSEQYLVFAFLDGAQIRYRHMRLDDGSTVTFTHATSLP